MSDETENGRIHLTVVYDGAPCSGKTESIRALGRLLGEEVVTPAEREGRTQYFDWLDYRGGQRMNRRVRYRVIAVPGQPELAARRELILSSADGVVFVADSGSAAFPESIERFRDLRARLAARNREIPVLVQLNKRDEDTALPVETMLSDLGPEVFWRSKESVATEGTGIREAFVLLVGEAIRGMAADGTIYRRGRSTCDAREPVIPSPRHLLRLMTRPAV